MNYEAVGLGTVSEHGLRERVLMLRAIEWFDGLDDRALLLLTEHARSVRYPPGAIVSRAGQAVRAVYVVSTGEVSLDREGADLRFGPGTAFGAMALLARKPLGLVRALTDTRILEIPAPVFEAAIDENFSVLRGTLRATGAAVLKARGNLPADPSEQREVELGTFHEPPRTLVERLIELDLTGTEVASATVRAWKKLKDGRKALK